mgnify:CR=1 FL=1
MSQDKLKVPEIVHSKWDEMVARYNSVVAKVNQISFNHYQLTAGFKTRSGIVVNLNDFDIKMRSVLYKLRWATKSLEYLIDFYERRTKSFDDTWRSIAEPIPDTFVFNADVFFSFAYSALDIAAGIIGMLVETGIKKGNVYFTNIMHLLADAKSQYAGPLLNELKTESDSGWIHEFRQYRIFFTHYAAIQPIGQLKYTANNKTTGINLYMLPDDPRSKPFTYERKREFAPYCQEVLVKELNVMAVLFEFVEKLI